MTQTFGYLKVSVLMKALGRKGLGLVKIFDIP